MPARAASLWVPCRAARLSAALTVATILLGAQPSARLTPADADACPPSHAKLDQRLHAALDRADETPQRVIVRARAGQRARFRTALAEHGDEVGRDLPSFESFSATVHADDVGWLAAHPDVEHLSTDAPVRATDSSDDASDDQKTALQVVRETLGVTSSWTGDGVGVAVVDSGIEPSPDFEGRLRAFYDFTRGGIATPASDDYGHGTHVAGLLGGEGKLSNSNEFMGIAPKVKMLALRVLDGRGAGYTSDVIAALEFAARNRQKLRIDIVNLSLGHPIYEPAATDPLVLSVEHAVRAGLVVVVAAGNHGRNDDTGETGYAGITSPGNAPSAITVGAITTTGTVSRHDDRVTWYSSRGPTWYDGFAKPDVVAPGHDLGATAAVHSWLYQTYPALRIRAQYGDYLRLSGTSMATGVVTGVIAHMIEANRNTNGSGAPPLTPNAIKAVLQYTALQVFTASGAAEDWLAQGAGSVNADGALAVARAIRTDAREGTFWLDPGYMPQTADSSIGDTVWPWAKVVVWGKTILTGSTVPLNHPAWATSVVWGSAKVVVWGKASVVVWDSAKVVVWGKNVVWTEPERWASSIIWGGNTIGQLDAAAKVVVWGKIADLTAETVAWADLEGLPPPAELDPGALTIEY